MKTEDIKTLNDRYVVNTYGVRKLALTRGEGVTLWDADGKEYLDFFAGIAVTNLGHCHPAVTNAVCEQARKLVHVSNLYYIEPQVRLAELLSRHCFAAKWFFCNGGAEANEAAIKLARRYWAQKGTPRGTVVSAEQSFHGRTLATITATGQPKYQQGFEPLPKGFKYVPFNDLNAMEQALTPDVGAVLLEPIQGEGGIRIPDPDYLRRVRELCDRKNTLLIFDEVQTGMGRTGHFFAHQHYGVTPDIMTLAKGLANGVPIGAMGCTEDAATGLGPGMHACTFGGNPLSTAAALATVRALTEPGFFEQVRSLGEYFLERLREIAAQHASVAEVRGVGLMIGIEFKEAAAPVVDKLIDAGVICGTAGPKVLRFVPPLIITTEHVDRVTAVLNAALGELGW